MSLESELRSRRRPEYDKLPIASTLMRHFELALDSREGIQAKRDGVRGDHKLSDIGRREKLREITALHARDIAKADRAVTTAKAQLLKRSAALSPQIKDKTDAAAALRRWEIREFLRGKPQAEVAGILFDPEVDSQVVDSVYEMPVFMSGISKEMKSQVLRSLLERNHSADLQVFAAESEAIDLVAAAVEGAMQTLFESVALPKLQFDAWLKTFAPTEKEAKAETSQFQVDQLTAEGLALPYEVRSKIIDALLDSNMRDAGMAT